MRIIWVVAVISVQVTCTGTVHQFIPIHREQIGLFLSRRTILLSLPVDQLDFNNHRLDYTWVSNNYNETALAIEMRSPFQWER